MDDRSRPSREQEKRIDESAGGAQGLERGLRILRDVAASGAWGLRLVDIERGTGLARSTAHRIAQTLVRHGFVAYDKATRRYSLGAEISILSASAPSETTRLRDIAGETLRQLARSTGDTAYLMVRSGNDAVCLAREMGPYPIKALTGEIGTRRPLGVGAAGVALLASLDEAEAALVRKANRGRLRRFPNASEKALGHSVAAARRDGFGESRGLVIDGVHAVGVVVHDPDGRVVAALSVAAVRERMTPEHRESVLQALGRARVALERLLRREGARGPAGPDY